MNTDARAIVFAIILGWLAGNEPVAPTLVDWLTTRETIGRKAGPADCTLAGNGFELRQVLLDVPEPKP